MGLKLLFFITIQESSNILSDQRLISNFFETISRLKELLIEVVNDGSLTIITLISASFLFSVLLIFAYFRQYRLPKNTANQKIAFNVLCEEIGTDLGSNVYYEVNDFEVQMQLDLARSLIGMKQHKEAEKVLLKINHEMTEAQKSDLKTLKENLDL